MDPTGGEEVCAVWERGMGEFEEWEGEDIDVNSELHDVEEFRVMTVSRTRKQLVSHRTELQSLLLIL